MTSLHHRTSRRRRLEDRPVGRYPDSPHPAASSQSSRVAHGKYWLAAQAQIQTCMARIPGRPRAANGSRFKLTRRPRHTCQPSVIAACKPLHTTSTELAQGVHAATD